MPLSPEERRESNRRNAARSTGPRSQAGKERSRANSLKHGLRAVVVPLPGEDPEVLAQREREWVEHYRPESPAARFLMSECLHATVISDRTHRHNVAVVSEQVRLANHQWNHQRADEINALRELLKTEPGQAVTRLTRTAHGCQFLIDVKSSASWSVFLGAIWHYHA